MIRRIVEDFVPLVREAEGLLAYYVLDAEDRTFDTITICERETQVEESYPHVGPEILRMADEGWVLHEHPPGVEHRAAPQ